MLKYKFTQVLTKHSIYLCIYCKRADSIQQSCLPNQYVYCTELWTHHCVSAHSSLPTVEMEGWINFFIALSKRLAFAALFSYFVWKVVASVGSYNRKMIGTSISMENSDLLLNPSISICRVSWKQPPTSDRTPNLTELITAVSVKGGPNSTRYFMNIEQRDPVYLVKIYFH